ncbi:MAG: hypothetical protein WBA13_14390 [Microcoleaceae cyanobacterium]
MNTKFAFIAKVILLSAVGAVLIKFAGPSLPVAGNSLTALTIVLLPSIILATLLGWRAINLTD